MHPTSGTAQTWRSKRLTHDGYYRRQWKEAGRLREQREHRWVWEAQYGKLAPGEDVHHRDGDRLNNALENLARVEHAEHAFQHRVGVRTNDRGGTAGRGASL